MPFLFGRADQVCIGESHGHHSGSGMQGFTVSRPVQWGTAELKGSWGPATVRPGSLQGGKAAAPSSGRAGCVSQEKAGLSLGRGQTDQ